MGLLKTGVKNNIVEWRAKSRQVDVHVNDASGFVSTLQSYDAYFYAKSTQ